MKNIMINESSCSDMKGFNSHDIENLSSYRQALADKAVSNKVSAVERIQARISLLVSFIPDIFIPAEELTSLTESITQLSDRLHSKNGHNNKSDLLSAHRSLRDLEGRVYIPLRRVAAGHFEKLHDSNPGLTGETLLRMLLSVEIDEYQARNPDVSINTVLPALMRSSPRADILINMIRHRNDEHQVTVFNWHPMTCPLLGI